MSELDELKLARVVGACGGMTRFSGFVFRSSGTASKTGTGSTTRS